MRKLFFFRSSTSNNGNNKTVPSPPTDEKTYWETPWENGVNNQVSDKLEKGSRSPKDLFSKSQKQYSSQNFPPTLGLRRSLSFSSASFGERNLISSCDHRSISPSTTSSNVPLHPSDYPVCRHSLTPDRHRSKAKIGEKAATRKACGVEKLDSPSSSSKGYIDSSGNSSYSSPPVPLKCGSSRLNHASNKVLDLYIDGEQQDRSLRPKNSSSQRKLSGNGNSARWRPPRVQSTAPTSPTGAKEVPRSYSFREMRDCHIRLSARNEFGSESPQKLAKNVIERLTQVFPKKPNINSRDLDPDTPTTVEDIHEDYLEHHLSSNSDGFTQKNCLSDGPCRTLNEYCGEEILGCQKHSHFLEDVPVGTYSVQTEENVDIELRRKAKEAADRVVLISEEIEHDNLFRDSTFSVSVLIQTIRNLTEERRSLALEVSAQLQCRIADRVSAKEALRVAKVEFDSQTRRLEREKNELQLGLEKELDRRSSDWSFKFEKYQSEEQRLRERVRELAEQNVSLQREVSSLNGKEVESKSRIAHSELQLKDLMARFEEAREGSQDLQQTLLELREQFTEAETERDSIQRSYKEKERENKELQKAVSRLRRTCSEQEKTIIGMRQGLSDEIEKKQSSEKFDNVVGKLQMELVRLAGVEHSLRREVESYRLEVETLRHENINLLDRLRGSGNDDGFTSFKLDQELQARVDYLQNQGLSLIDESCRLCAKLLELIKVKTGTEPGQEVNRNGLDSYFLVESDMKVQSLKRGFENLKRTLLTVSSLLHEKSIPVTLESQSQITEGGGSGKLNSQVEDNIRFELKAETLLTSALREKLFSKQQEVEQLQAELATAVRGHDILRCEVQASLDALSSISHKMKDLELQMLRKDESINHLKSDLQECTKELTITKGILPKVSEERDLMWEEVKQYSEKNMLLNSEVNLLRKKIEALDEDILLKEGQITILKDSLDNKPFDILYSPKSLHEFRLE